MEMHIKEIAERIRGLREMLDIAPQEMAKVTGLLPGEYIEMENGNIDFTFTFLMKCAQRFGVDIVELMSGSGPRLSSYTIVRKDAGLPIERRQGFKYRHLAYLFKGKLTEPFIVTAPYNESEQAAPLHLSTHDGQELDYILNGSLKVSIDGHAEILKEGDAVYYDSSKPHGMIATGGEDCDFLAIVIKKQA